MVTSMGCVTLNALPRRLQHLCCHVIHVVFPDLGPVGVLSGENVLLYDARKLPVAYRLSEELGHDPTLKRADKRLAHRDDDNQ